MHRLWKLELIERLNPGWRDLYDDVSTAGGDSEAIGPNAALEM
jgi:hypothetical protein